MLVLLFQKIINPDLHRLVVMMPARMLHVITYCYVTGMLIGQIYQVTSI